MQVVSRAVALRLSNSEEIFSDSSSAQVLVIILVSRQPNRFFFSFNSRPTPTLQSKLCTGGALGNDVPRYNGSFLLVPARLRHDVFSGVQRTKVRKK